MPTREIIRTLRDFLTDRPSWTYAVSAKLPGRLPAESGSGEFFFTRTGAEYAARQVVVLTRRAAANRGHDPDLTVCTYRVWRIDAPAVP